MPTPLPIVGRPIRLAVVGLGQISELCLPTLRRTHRRRDRGAVRPRRDARRDRWASEFPDSDMHRAHRRPLESRRPTSSTCWSPRPRTGRSSRRSSTPGFHVQVQKPIARSLEDADAHARGRDAHRARRSACSRTTCSIRRSCSCATSCARARSATPAGVHMKIVGTGRGGWDVPEASYRWQFEQAQDGRGMLVFDHGWHQLAVAHWLFGPIRRIFGWIGSTQVAPEIAPEITARRAVDARVGARQRRARGARHHVRARHVLPLRLLQRATNGSRSPVPAASCVATAVSSLRHPGAVGRGVRARVEMREYHALADDPARRVRGVDAEPGRRVHRPRLRARDRRHDFARRSRSAADRDRVVSGRHAAPRAAPGVARRPNTGVFAIGNERRLRQR